MKMFNSYGGVTRLYYTGRELVMFAWGLSDEYVGNALFASLVWVLAPQQRGQKYSRLLPPGKFDLCDATGGSPQVLVYLHCIPCVNQHTIV